MNDQRKVVFEQRIELMREQDVSGTIADMRHSVIEDLVARHIPENAYPEQWDAAGLKTEVENVLGLPLPIDEWAKEEGIADQEVRERIARTSDEVMAGKVAKYGAEIMRYVEKSILLQTLDHLWREHLVMLEHLRQVIGFRGYAQRDPLNEYKSEAFQLFDTLLTRLREGVSAQLLRVEIVASPPTMDELPPMEAHHINPATGEDEMAFAASVLTAADGARALARDRKPDDPSTWGKVGRNEHCPCGSGKKYKHCHGRLA
jgi:preprotein translocase subunit SecA